MKKLMIAAAMVCAAAISQAATINWGGAATVEAEGQVALLLWSETAFTKDPATTLTGTTVGSTADNGGSVVATYTLQGTDVVAEEFYYYYDKVSSGVDGYYAILIANEEKTYASYMYMKQVSGTSAASAPTDVKYNEGWSESDTNHLAMNDYTVQIGSDPTPEPTSAMLMLLGMAGLALKRKRA